MNRKIKKIILIFLIAIFILVTLFFVTSDIRKVIKSSEKRKGFDILLQDKDICTLSIDGDTMWAGGAAGLFKIDMKSLTSQEVGHYKYIRAVLSTEKGLWIGHDEGLTFMGSGAGAGTDVGSRAGAVSGAGADAGSGAGAGAATVTYTTKDGLPDNRVNAITIDKDQRIWVGTWGGAVVIDNKITVADNKIIKTYTKEDGLLDNMVNVIMQDNLGGMWFGSYVAPRGGISLLYDGKWQYFTTDNSLLHANINAIIQTQDKTVLAGGGLYTKGGGTRFVYDNSKWIENSKITKKDGLAGEKIRSLFEDSQNRLWVGSEYDGLVVMSKNNVVKLTKETGLSNDEVKVIKEDMNKNIWIGTREGITRISQGAL